MDPSLFSIKTNNVKPEKGKVLISEPFLEDGIFHRSVILLTQYSPKDGAMGFVLNKLVPENYKLKQLVEEYGNLKLNIGYGGPVELEKMFYIHTLPPEELPYSMQIMPGLFWGGDYEVLKRKILSGEVSTDKVRFFIGYSGWAPLQLESELERDAWIVGEITPELVLTPDPELWRKILQNFEFRYKLWSTYPEEPYLN